MAFFRDFNVKQNLGLSSHVVIWPKHSLLHDTVAGNLHPVACWKGNHPRIWDWEFQKPSSSDCILSCAPPECVFFFLIFFVGCKIGAQLGNIWLGFLTIKLFRISEKSHSIHQVDPSCSLSAAATFTTRETPHPSHGHPSHGHTVTVTQHGLQGIQGCGAPSRNSCGAGGSKGEMGSRIWDGDILGYSWSPGKWELWIKGYTGIMYCIHIYTII